MLRRHRAARTLRPTPRPREGWRAICRALAGIAQRLSACGRYVVPGRLARGTAVTCRECRRRGRR